MFRSPWTSTIGATSMEVGWALLDARGYCWALGVLERSWTLLDAHGHSWLLLAALGRSWTLSYTLLDAIGRSWAVKGDLGRCSALLEAR